MSNLVIVESPNKCKKISSYLGANFRVVATVGHFRDLPKKQLGVDIDSMKPTYEVYKKDVVARLKKEARSAKRIFIATDPDREGEAIGWHIAQVLNLNGKALRISFNEVTKEALKKAVANPRPIDQDLVNAQQARRVLDRIVGFKVSPLLWSLGQGLSAGRVQTAALHLVCQRERDRLEFKPEPYWVVQVTYENGIVSELSDEDGKAIRPKDEATAQAALEKAKISPHTVIRVERTERTKNPPAPFYTSTLQQAASSRLGFVPDKTMQVAQALFENGHITYHRTDSPVLSDDAITLAREWIAKNRPKSLPEKPKKYKSKANAQEAHEAIRPTILGWPVDMSRDQKKLYDLIRTRFLASQMKPARLAKTVVITQPETVKETYFAAQGTVILEAHWIELEPPEEKTKDQYQAPTPDGTVNDTGGAAAGVAGADLPDQKLPVIQRGEKLTVAKATNQKKETKPPARYSEAGLIKKMEKLGIGRPSTYAATISTLFRRDYIESIKKVIAPRPLGMQVDDLMIFGLKSLTSPNYTAKMEEVLDEIAAGKMGWINYLKEWWSVDFKLKLAKAAQIWGEKIAELQKRSAMGSSIPDQPGTIARHGAKKTLGLDPCPPDCPECGKPMIKRKGKNGKFLGCSGYPGCRHTENIGKHPSGTAHYAENTASSDQLRRRK